MTLQDILKAGGEGRAIAASGTVATHEPSPRSRPLRVSIDYRGTLRPTFVCRQHKTPHPKGHRTYLEVKR